MRLCAVQNVYVTCPNAPRRKAAEPTVNPDPNAPLALKQVLVPVL